MQTYVKIMLNKVTFRCARCGECCKNYLVVLDEEDIKRIESLSYPRSQFVDQDYDMESRDMQFVLKRKNNQCVFLTLKEGKSDCQIYAHRPRICRIYPFFRDDIETCKPVKQVKIHDFSKNI